MGARQLLKPYNKATLSLACSRIQDWEKIDSRKVARKRPEVWGETVPEPGTGYTEMKEVGIKSRIWGNTWESVELETSRPKSHLNRLC